MLAKVGAISLKASSPTKCSDNKKAQDKYTRQRPLVGKQVEGGRRGRTISQNEQVEGLFFIFSFFQEMTYTPS